jgi:outer membrane protein OmpA-like peptidoglycan-associated protein
MKFYPHCGLTIILAFITHIGWAQTAIVLINEQPTRVSLNNKGEISKVYNKVPGYMSDFKKAPRDEFKKFELSDIDNNEDLVMMAPQTLSETDATQAAAVNAQKEEAIDIEDSDNRVSPSIYFDMASAILSEESLNTIKAYASVLKERGANSVLLKSWYKSGDKKSQELVENRLEACRQFLETQGVASNIILTSIVDSNRESSYVSVIVN